jgi:ABC-2 type transport system ATP-binding protein
MVRMAVGKRRWRAHAPGVVAPVARLTYGSPMTNAINVQRLRKTYGDIVAVDEVTFDVSRGEIFGIIGPNGSGKTTTVECLQGLRIADSGDVSVLGLDPRTQGEVLRRRIGSQLQESALPERIKVWEALDLFVTASSARRPWQEVAQEWSIFHRRNSVFANLSGGERQRLFIALALITDPELVFLDEMTTGLDPAARRVAWSLIRSVRDRGTTVVLVTHFMDEVEHLCDRVAVFRDGRVLVSDSPSRLVQQHGSERTVRFSTVDGDVSWLSGVTDVDSYERQGDAVTVHGHDGVLAHVAAALVERQQAPADLRVEMPTLEDVYMRLVEKPPEEGAVAS